MVNDNQANQSGMLLPNKSGMLSNKSTAQLNQLCSINWHNHQNFQSCAGFLILKLTLT